MTTCLRLEIGILHVLRLTICVCVSDSQPELFFPFLLVPRISHWSIIYRQPLQVWILWISLATTKHSNLTVPFDHLH